MERIRTMGTICTISRELTPAPDMQRAANQGQISVHLDRLARRMFNALSHVQVHAGVIDDIKTDPGYRATFGRATFALSHGTPSVLMCSSLGNEEFCTMSSFLGVYGVIQH